MSISKIHAVFPAFTTPRNNYQYNSKEHHNDFDLGWSDYGARWYDPQVGRWWSADPLAEIEDGVSTYAYVGNNPLLYTDPDGRYKSKEKARAMQGRASANGYFTGHIQGESGNFGFFYGLNGNYTTSKTDFGPQGGGGWNNIQLALTGIGLVPALGEVADIANGGISLFRAFLSGENAHYVDAGMNFGSSIPFAGYFATAGKAGMLFSLFRKGPKSGDDLMTIYRGVNSTAGISYTNAMKGIVKPRGGFFGHSDVLKHNTGLNGTVNSKFTSWTTDIDVALNYAYRTNGKGILLKMDVPRSSLYKSPNLKSINLFHKKGVIVSESEWLLKGSVNNINLKHVNF